MSVNRAHIDFSKSYFQLRILAWLLASVVPVIFWCYMPRQWLTGDLYHLLGLLSASWGAIIASLLKRALEKPFDELKRNSRLMPMPRQDAFAVSIRLGYILSKLVSELNLLFLALYAAYLMMKLFT